MTITNNDIPPFAEEKTLYSEQNNLEQILSQFKQPIPSSFIELKQLNWMCSTQGWKKPTCERYNCLINGEWKQIDIRHSLLEELGLEAKNIPYSLHISPTVLDKGLDPYFAYNVEKEKEIFLNRPLTVNDLPAALQKWKDEIKTLKEQNTNKNNRLFQLNQILQGSALIFQKQQQIIDNLTTKLEAEKEKNTDSADYQQHLQRDILNLAEQRKELEESGMLKDSELEKLEQANKELSDKLAILTKQLWHGFYDWLINDLGLKEAGNNTLDSVFTKAPGKYPLLEKIIGWMLFWKSLENTVAERPDFRTWTKTMSEPGIQAWIRPGTGAGIWSRWSKHNGSEPWTRSGSKFWTSIGTWTGTEFYLPPFESDKSLWDIFYNKHKIVVFFSNEQITQFNQIFTDWKAEKESQLGQNNQSVNQETSTQNVEKKSEEQDN